MTQPLQAVLLAAGEGSRLRPLTDTIPKPLLPINGVAVLEQLLRQLAAAHVEKTTIVVGYRQELIRSFVADLGLPGIDFAHQPSADGSGDALQHALAHGVPRADTLIAATDTVFRTDDLQNVVGAFRAHDPMAVMGLRRWPVEQLPHRSMVRLDEAGLVEQVIEKPLPHEMPSGATALAGAPLFVVRSDFWTFVEAITPSEHGKLELATALQAAISHGHAVRGVEIFESRDITRPNDLLRENFPYLRPLLEQAAVSRSGPSPPP